MSGPLDDRVDVAQARGAAGDHLVIELGDPLAIVVVWLVLHPLADRAREPIFGGLAQTAADILEHQRRADRRGLHQHEASIEPAFQQRREPLSIEFALRLRPHFEHALQRARPRQAFERQLPVKEIAIPAVDAELDTGHQPPHRVGARAQHLVRPLPVIERDQDAVGLSVVQPVQQRAECDRGNHGRPQ